MRLYDAIKTQCWEATTNCFSILGMSDVPIIFANQTGTEPEGTYCILNISDTKQIGKTQESTLLWDGPNGEAFRTMMRVFHLDIQCSFVGDDSFSCAYDFYGNMAGNNVCREEYFKKGFAPNSKPTVQRLPKFREADWKEQAVVLSSLRYSQITYQDTNWVEYIKLNDVIYKITKD